MTSASVPVLPADLLTLEEKAAHLPTVDRKTCVPNGMEARRSHEALKLADKKRSHKRALHKAMIDGARPFPEDQSGQCNLNFQDGKAIMQQSAVPFYALFNGVRNYATIMTPIRLDAPESAQWGDKISKRFHDLLSRWNGFDWNVQQASYWMRLHGTGPCYFDKHRLVDWRFRAVETGAVFVPEGTASCVDERIPMLEIVVPYRAHELYGFIRSREAASTAGWKIEAVKNAVRWACRNQEWAKTTEGGWAPWEKFEQMFNNSSLYPSLTGGFVNCVHQLFKEWDGKITKIIVTEESIPSDGRPDTVTKDQDFLFQSIGAYEDYNECIVVFFKDIGDGTWHSVKGYGSDAFDSLVVGNQMLCQAIDAARVDSTILLEFATTQQRDKFDKFKIMRGITKLPVGAKVVQARMQGSMQGVIAVEQLLRNKLHNNIGNFQGRGMSREDGRGETVTATEVQARVAKEASIDEGERSLFYGYLDHLYQEMFSRASDPKTTDEEAKRFQEECAEDGIPPEALADCEVRANRESGYGSPAMRELKMQQGNELAPKLPTDGQQNLLDMQISTIFGPDKVELLNPRQHQPDMNDWGAAMENGMIEMGVEPPLVSGQDDTIHLHSHLAASADKLLPVKEAMDAGQADAAMLQQAFEYTQVMASHCQQHLDRLMQDPSSAAQGKMFADQLSQIVAFSGKLRSAVITAEKEAQLAAQQAEQATSIASLDAAKIQSVRNHDMMAAMKAQTSIRDKAAKAASDIQIKRFQALADVQIKRQQAVQMPPEKKKAA